MAKKSTALIYQIKIALKGFGRAVRVPSYRRPLSGVVNPLVKAGFTVEQVLEPIPTEAFRQALPEDYEELSKAPGFMCVRAVKG